MNTKNLSSELIEIVPLVMRAIRAEMRGIALPELSVAQFRILSRLDREPQSNKQLADWVGVSTAAMSRTIEVLVVRGYVLRKAGEKDRREVVLALSPAGKKKYETIKTGTKEKLMPKLENLSVSDRKKIDESLQILKEVFSAK